MPAVEASRLELERPTATGLEYLECLDYDSFVKWLSWKLKKPQEIKYISWKGVQTSSGTRNLLQRRLHHKLDDWKTMTNSNSSNKNTHLSNSATQQPFPHPRARRFRADSYRFSCLSILASGQRLRTCMSKARAVCGCASLFSERVSQSGQAFYSMWSFFFNLFSKCSLNKTQLVWKCYIKSLVSLSFFVLFDLYLDHHWYPTATELGAALPPGCIHIPP